MKASLWAILHWIFTTATQKLHCRQKMLNNSSTVVHLRHSNGADMLMMGDVEKDREAVLLSGELADISDVDI